jgi:hypothetical protein
LKWSFKSVNNPIVNDPFNSLFRILYCLSYDQFKVKYLSMLSNELGHWWLKLYSYERLLSRKLFCSTHPWGLICFRYHSGRRIFIFDDWLFNPIFNFRCSLSYIISNRLFCHRLRKIDKVKVGYLNERIFWSLKFRKSCGFYK